MNIIFIASLLILFVLLATAIFQWLWNITMPEVFGLARIRFWIAFRLLLIAGFLAGGQFIPISLR
jgi:hypothetical protein